MSKLLDLRFSVRASNNYESNVWKVWATSNGDVYLATRNMASIEKFSFHASGICRSAFTNEHGIPPKMEDRAMVKWRRMQTPPVGERRASCVARIAFPTSFLSRPIKPHKKKIYWVDAAPVGGATVVDLIYTRETQDDVLKAFQSRGERILLSYTQLSDNEAFAIFYTHTGWEDKDLKIPGEGEVNDLLFSSNDPLKTGRPIRIQIRPLPNDGDALHITELGGYALPGISTYSNKSKQ